MEDIAASSISKGCFFIPGNAKSSTIQASDHFDDCGVKPQLRWKMAQKIWNEIEDSISNLHIEIQEKLFNDLVQYIKLAQEKQYEKNDLSRGKRTEIPTAALITGVNMTDHVTLFSQLYTKIKEDVSSYVAILEAKNCSNMKSLMRALGDQLLNVCEDNEKDGTTNNDLLVYMKKKSTPLTISMLEKWYFKSIATKFLQTSPSKKRKLINEIPNPPIIVICQQLEAFSPKVLQEFILMCSFHAQRLPIVFVFGIATSWSDVSQRLLPHSAIVHLSVERFHAPSASSHLALIIDRILLTSQHPFKLSGKCFQLILDVFLCHDFSIANFLHTLKFCVMEHFYEQSASIACCASLQESIDMICNLKKNELKEFKKIESMKRHLASLKADKQKCIKDGTKFKALVAKLLEDLHQFHNFYFSALRSLHAFTATLPHYPMGKQIRELYCSCFRTELTKHDGFQQAFTILKVSSRDQLIERLESCLKPLQLSELSSDSSQDELHFSTACSRIKYLINSLKSIGENDEVEMNENTEDREEQLETVKYAYQLQERLRAKAEKKRVKKMTKYEKLREEALTFLRKFYEYHLRKVKSFPLYEVFYFDSSATIRRHIVAAPRLSIQTALSDPYQYLQVASLETAASGVIPSNAPDICVAYKLHNESGNIINLYDWLMAFQTVVTSQREDKENEHEESDDVDDITQARFIKAVSELQFLGFIKPTKKKTDHVQRLTWSHT
ncbi:origin recognition complex subunit 3-like [Clavelina lepadiformis]|uniref:origin recognition complex subunit 3-like n=1 Tax=Clavelina lepadiformis TaxID=159417 RepID=UPI0040431A86